MRGLCGETAGVVGSFMAIQAYSHSGYVLDVGVGSDSNWRQVAASRIHVRSEKGHEFYV